MEKTNKFCQSCGMPIDKDPKKGGSNADGTINLMYCSYCYQKGEFIFKGTAREMQLFCREKMIEQGMSKFTAWFFSLGIPRLERWKK